MGEVHAMLLHLPYLTAICGVQIIQEKPANRKSTERVRREVKSYGGARGLRPKSKEH
jgi:hypothetical protein